MSSPVNQKGYGLMKNTKTGLLQQNLKLGCSVAGISFIEKKGKLVVTSLLCLVGR